MIHNNNENIVARNNIQDHLIKSKEIKLTQRERECLHYLSVGYSAKKIGQELKISSRTVEIHIANMKRKLECHTRLELLARIKSSSCQEFT